MKNANKILPFLLTAATALLLTAGISYGQEGSGPQTAGQLFEKALFAEEVKGNLSEAIELYRQVLDDNSGNRQLTAQALLHMGMCYEKLGSEQARKLYREVISKYSDYPEEVARANDRMSRLDAYVAELNRKAEKHMKEGNELFKRWEYESAIREYENAIRLRPNTLLAMNAQYCIGQSWYRAGNYEEALATLTDLIEENPRSTIAPVTELMLSQVQYAMENDVNKTNPNTHSSEDLIVDPETGITYTKIKTFTGKNDLIQYTSGGFGLSPDGRFLILENKIIPVDGSDPFDLVEMEALRVVYSPDMTKAAFYADSAICMVPVSPETGHASGPPVKLVKGIYIFQHPVSWSPDGEKIAFSRRDKLITDDIWTISVSDGELRPVSNFEGHEYEPAWSPDGKKIAFVYERSIFLFSTETNETEMIIENSFFPTWSPDSKWLHYIKLGEQGYFLSLDEQKSYKLKHPEQVSDFIGFSTDGKKMLFYHKSYENIWKFKALSVSGGPAFSPAPDNVYDARWSTDGKVIIALSNTSHGDYIFKLIPIDGGEPLPVKIDRTGLNGDPFPIKASPDLTRLTFWIAGEDGRKDIYTAPLSVAEARTTSPARLIFKDWSAGAYNTSFSWSPDGSRLGLIHKEDIWIVPLEGGSPMQITDTPDHELYPRWSPDGTKIKYITMSADKRIAHVIPATGGISKIMHTNINTGSWTPDSKNTIILSNGEISLISLTGEKLKHIVALNDLGFDDVGSPVYSPDGSQFALSGPRGNKWAIYLYSIENESFTLLTEEEEDIPMYGLDWSPDGKWISYQTMEDVKIRPEGTMWEADFQEIKEKLVSQ